MLVLTGREARTLPVATVRALFWRIAARQLWDNDLVMAARTPLPAEASFEARIGKADAMAALRTIEDLLFPEDD